MKMKSKTANWIWMRRAFGRAEYPGDYQPLEDF